MEIPLDEYGNPPDKYGAAPTPGPNDVVFTQYLRPHGRTIRVWIERSPEIATMAKALFAAGCRLECEELTTGHASFTVERDDTDEGDTEVLAHQLGPNGPGVPDMVDALVREAYAKVVEA